MACIFPIDTRNDCAYSKNISNDADNNNGESVMTYIYQTLNKTYVARQLLSDDYAKWSLNGADALANYLENIAEDTGEPIQLDVVALRCDFSEYKNLADFNQQTGRNYESIDALCADAEVILFDGGLIVSNF